MVWRFYPLLQCFVKISLPDSLRHGQFVVENLVCVSYEPRDIGKNNQYEHVGDENILLLFPICTVLQLPVKESGNKIKDEKKTPTPQIHLVNTDGEV